MHPPLHFPDTTATHSQLPNGLDIIIKEDHHAEVVSLQAWCGAGSIHEDEWLGAGLSHILEHMLFKGTARRKGPEIATQVQDAGGYINAYTSFDRTVYWIDAPSDGAETCLDVLLDVMTQATLPEADYAKEQEVIRREFAMGFDDPNRMSSQLLFATAFQQHPYKHPVIGHLDIFNQLSREDVLAYYKRHYVPNNMLFVVVGAIDSEKIHQQIANQFQALPRQVYTPVVIPSEPVQLGRRDAHQEFDTQLTKMHLAWHIPNIAHPDTPALDVLAAILGQGRSSRLYRVIREELQLAHAIGAHAYTPVHGGIFSVSATADAGKRPAIEEAVSELLDAIILDGVHAHELEKAKKSCLADMLNELTTMRGQANDLATNWMLSRNLNFTRDYLTAIRGVDADGLRSTAKRYLVESNLTSVSLNPPGSLTPSIPAARNKTAIKTRKITLDNGLTILLHEDHRVPLVALRASFFGGLLGENAATSGITQLSSRCLLKGTIHRSAAELAETMEGVGGSIGAGAGNNTLSVSASCLEEDLSLALDLLSDVILHPTFPEPEVAREKKAQVAGIKAESDNLVRLGVRRLRKALFGDHPYANVRLGTESSVVQLGPDDTRAFHRDYITGTNGILALYGAIDAASAEALVRRYLEHLPSGKRAFTDIPAPAKLTTAQTLDLATDKQQAVLIQGFPNAALDSPDRLILDLIEEACSDMSSRLFTRIREEMGLAYYVSAAQMLGLAPGVFYFYLGTDPQKLDDVQAALNTEVAKLAAKGLEPHELARAKKTLLGKSEMELQRVEDRASIEALDELYGFGHDYHKTLRDRLETITLEDVQRILTAYFHEKPSVTVRISPLLGKGETGISCHE